MAPANVCKTSLLAYSQENGYIINQFMYKTDHIALGCTTLLIHINISITTLYV